MLKYADVILPLPLQGTFTYALPTECEAIPQVGCRVIVPFGSRKFYTAIVIRLHNETPPYAIKSISEILDPAPIVLAGQIRLWQWIADYYLCALGDVFKAALPSGLKLESESTVLLNENWEAESSLTPSEEKVWRVLANKISTKGGQTLANLQKEAGLKNILPVVKGLLEKGAVQMKEELRRTYKPKTVICVRLVEAYSSEARLHEALDAMHRSPRQEALLTCFLELKTPSVEKQTLLQASGCSDAILRELCQKGILETYAKPVERIQVLPNGEKVEGKASLLTEPQQQAMNSILQQWQTHNVCLLHGVTSSGKTEIYIHLIQQAIAEGKQVLFMLPEIVLTAQLTERLRRVFGDRLGIYHSRYPDNERVELYQKMLSDKPYDIVVGVRSSIFLPFQRLGLLIIDEEHETSFKQQDPAPRYHARNAALVLATQNGAKVLLGSATPSLESYHNALNGKYGLTTLKTRYAGLSLPTIEIVDVQEMRRKKMMSGVFSPQLLAHIRQTLEQRNQVILFQNRRGYAPVMECRVCGWTPRCEKCDVSLTVHRSFRPSFSGSGMVCHYCGATYAIPSVCPNCGEYELYHRGYGTERIEEQLQSILPDARIARMDLDTTRSRQNYEQILHDFEQGDTDILIGTQMVTKGLDFDRVSLVGILSADTMLSQPDFRSYERAFQLMEQVAGRAGRKGFTGHVVLQTRDAGNAIVHQVVAHDYESMYAEQMQERKLFLYPPFCRVVFIYLKHRDENVVEKLSTDFAVLLRKVFRERVLGPDTPPVGRVQLMHIRKLILKIELTAPMSAVRQRLIALQNNILSQPDYRSAQIYYDVD
ncbi:MAG: primosomal protein N' [Bacteroidaceae bacterium]|nr:primosomal protein N' [Bacteroidaceae bacterium]